MRLDHLAGPFRMEQIGKTLWRILFLYEIGVVAERRDQDARRDMERVGIVVGLVEMPGNVLRQVMLKPPIALPDDTMRLVGGIDHVDGVDAARIFLIDALEDPLGA